MLRPALRMRTYPHLAPEWFQILTAQLLFPSASYARSPDWPTAWQLTPLPNGGLCPLKTLIFDLGKKRAALESAGNHKQSYYPLRDLK
jgi:hypothetical protein